MQQGNFDRYEVLRINEMPVIEVYLVPSHEAPGGIGEASTPPTGPAVANAIFAATGKRILPAYYSENYVSLLPGEERSITIEFAAGESKAAIGLRGWNLGTETIGAE